MAASEQAEAHIVVDDDDVESNDADSTLGEVSRSFLICATWYNCCTQSCTLLMLGTVTNPLIQETSSTASLTSSIRRYRLENGRTYHAYKEGSE